VVGTGLALGLLALIIITAVSPLFDGDLTVSSYDAVLKNDGTLEEHYTYNVGSSGEYRMLYRIWESPVTLNTSTEPYIRLVSMTPAPGTIGYMKDNSGHVTVFGSSATGSSLSTIEGLAEYDEVGIFNPASYNSGLYTAEYTYIINPPLEYDSTTTHLNLKLAGETHIPYPQVKVTIPASGIDQVYVYPPLMKTEKMGDSYVITGSLAANEILAVEMLGPSDGFSQFPGFRNAVADVRGKTSSAAFWYNMPYYGAYLMNILGKIAVILVPLLLVVIYYLYGREKEFTVPAYLSTLPGTNLKPWQVNLLIKGDAMDFDDDGYYATLLDLHRRKNISITEKGEGKGIIVKTLSNANLDPYEQRVLMFLQLVSENGVLDTDSIEALAKKAQMNRTAEEKALKFQRSLTDVTNRVDTSISTQYIVDGRDHIIPLGLVSIVMFGIALILFFVASMQSYIIAPAVVLWVVVLVQVVIAYAAPSTLFGHWKDDRYKEKLEWDAFTHFLSDMAMIQKYAPADLTMWGDWLVYGTALGVGDKVEKAMKALNIRVADAGLPVGAIGMNYAFLPLLSFSPPSHGSSGGGGFGGGSFGGGGGFGGGGAGGR
jgi:uncharacterized membrane protein